MKRLLIALVAAAVVWASVPLQAAIAWVQDDANGVAHGAGTDAQTVAIAMGSNVGSGSLMVVVARYNASMTFTSVTDTRSTSYTSHGTLTYDTGGTTLRILSGITGSSGALTATLSVTGCTGGCRLGIIATEFSGTFTDCRLDGSLVGATGSSTAASSGNIVTTVADALLFATVGTSGTPGASLGTGYSNLIETTAGRIAAESKVVSSTGTYVGDFTITNQAWGAAVVALTEQACASSVPRLLMLGA